MEEKLKPFIEEYSDDFYESIEDIRIYLRNNNKEYIELKSKIHKLMDKNLKDGLSKEECKDLSKILVLYDSLEDIVVKEIYFKGGLDAYYYFKRIGLI